MLSLIKNFIEDQLLKRPVWVLVAVIGMLAVFSSGIEDFELDASAESLILEEDKDLKYFRELSKRYGQQEFLVLTYTPQAPLFSVESLTNLTLLRDDLREVQGIDSVISVMDVPLLSNPPVPIDQLVDNIKTLEDPDADIELAKKELANSPLYVNMLLNLDKNTTALQIKFPIDTVKEELLAARQTYYDLYASSPTKSLLENIDGATQTIKEHNADQSAKTRQLIKDVREILTKYHDVAEIHLGGAPMIIDDIIRYVRNDLINFGVGVLVFLVGMLWLIFRKLRWVMIPLICCAAVVYSMIGLLGILHWQVTVISSNFISLLLILTLSMCIHLIVRYREIYSRESLSHLERVRKTLEQVFVPCLYMCLTTGVAFMSLIVSGIRPVINFGWMMTLGIVASFTLTFIIFPAVVMLIGPKSEDVDKEGKNKVTRFLARLTLRFGGAVLAVSVLMFGFTVIGASKLIVENSFIDYFDESTEIYQGMTVIDQRLGGTTPLEVIIDFPAGPDITKKTVVEVVVYEEDEEEFVDEGFLDEDFLDGDLELGFADDFVTDVDPEKYWFTAERVATIKKVHQYLDSLDDTGKVISLATMIEIAEGFNDGESFSTLQLALLYGVIPEEFREIVIYPYVSVEQNQARINVRMIDSSPTLNRANLLVQIQNDLNQIVESKEGTVKISGMMVLYNNMLQSLFESQILTLGAVFAGIMIMFLALFRNIKLAIIAMIPNLLAAGFVLSVMGWMRIPLDMMTITIASITIGIAVDNTIHYIVRFKQEFEIDRNYQKAVFRSHATIGRAMFYTSLTIIAGFSILVLSNFKPTIYFGVLTAIAMLIALLGSLTLLPRMLQVFKAFGLEQKNQTK